MTGGNPYHVMMAGPKDEQDIFDQCLMLHEENGIFPLSEERVWEEIRRATQRQGSFIGIIRGDDGTLEASVCLALQPIYYSTWKQLCEYWLFVRPDKRQSERALHLIEFAKWCADEMSKAMTAAAGDDAEVQKECPLTIGIITLQSLLPKMRLYQRKLPQVGATFMYRHVPKDVANQRELAAISYRAAMNSGLVAKRSGRTPQKEPVKEYAHVRGR